MRAVIQRVNNATLTVNGEKVSEIGEGFLVFVGYTNGDNEKIIDYVVDRIVGMRIFRDENGKLNKTLKDINGEVMCVSNFTLYGNAATGRRPDFSKSAHFDVAKPMYDYTLGKFKEMLGKVASGIFGEHMHIDMSNDGPVTMIIEKQAD